MPETGVSLALIDATYAVLELDARLTDEGIPYETRTRRLTEARAVLRSWTSGVMSTERAEHALRALLDAAS